MGPGEPTRRRLFRLLLLLLVALTYRTSVGNGFTWDDEYAFVSNPSVRGSAVPDVFDPQTASSDPELNRKMYRPVRTAVLFAVQRAFGPGPAAFHLLNILLHGAVCLLLHELLLRLGFAEVAAAAAVLLFGVHPLGTEVVASVVGVADLLAALFGLAALVVVAGPGGESGRWTRWPALVLLSALAGLSKEVAYVLPAAAGLVVAFPFRGPARPRDPGERLGDVALLAGVAASTFALRFLMLGSATNSAEWPGGTLGRTLAMQAVVVARYLRLVFVPVGQSVRHVVEIPESFLAPEVLASAAILAALGILAIAGFRRAPVASWSLLWFFAWLLPAMNLVPLAGDMMGERFCYLPMMGLLAGVAEAVHRAAAPRGPEIRRAAALLAVAAVAALATTTAVRLQAWSSNLALFEDGVRKSPRSNALRLNLAREYERLGRRADALEQLRGAAANTDFHFAKYSRLAAAARERGDADEARVWEARAQRMRPAPPGRFAPPFPPPVR